MSEENVKAEAIRIDRWLWFARFFKSRSLAAKLVQASKVRVDGRLVNKASYAVSPGHVLTFPQGRHIRTVRVRAAGTRRGPPDEARDLYDDLAPPEEATPMPLQRTPFRREKGSGRPTKAERRQLDSLRDSGMDGGEDRT